MLTSETNRDDSRLSFWLRVREFAVPPSMIETATARRSAGDWAGACAAAGFDVDIDLRAAERARGREFAGRVRADLRHLAPDLLRWHLPRIAPDGLLRPGLTIALARYPTDGESHCGGADSVYLVARTAPAWADAGQRISLALWDGSRNRTDLHPHPRPDLRFRLDLHRHLWDARCSDELLIRSGATQSDDPTDSDVLAGLDGCAVGTWAAEARTLLHADGRDGPVLVRLGGRRRIVVAPADRDSPELLVEQAYPRGSLTALPVLPAAATWILPDLELLRTGAITTDRLHPLVAQALRPVWSADGPRTPADRPSGPGLVECRGELHRIGLVDGVLSALDHDPAELRREELLVALTGTPLPCLQVIDRAHRNPDCLAAVRERLSHGDVSGALAVVEELLGPQAALRDGALRADLETAARRRIVYGLFRSGLTTQDRVSSAPHYERRRGRGRSQPRLAIVR